MTLIRFLVIQRGVFGRPTPFGGNTNRDLVFVRALSDTYLVSGVNQLRPLGPRAAHLHLAPGDGFHRQRPRLEEPRGPEPLVDADGARRSCQGCDYLLNDIEHPVDILVFYHVRRQKVQRVAQRAQQDVVRKKLRVEIRA